MTRKTKFISTEFQTSLSQSFIWQGGTGLSKYLCQLRTMIIVVLNCCCIYIYIYIYIYNIIWSGTVAKVEQAFRSESLRHKFAKFEPVAGMMKITISGG